MWTKGAGTDYPRSTPQSLLMASAPIPVGNPHPINIPRLIDSVVDLIPPEKSLPVHWPACRQCGRHSPGARWIGNRVWASATGSHTQDSDRGVSSNGPGE